MAPKYRVRTDHVETRVEQAIGAADLLRNGWVKRFGAKPEKYRDYAGPQTTIIGKSITLHHGPAPQSVK